ncbi:MAG: MATE family efflux transporter [Eubacteriaceae bacterium]|nr:MATE family efflux transporter [Eubacteriaceae bacterium]
MKKQDLTQGPIGKQILVFALPLMASSFIQQLYNTVDLIYAGRLGTGATAAVGASSLVIACIINFFTGLSVGMSVIASQAVGAKDPDKVRRAIGTGMAISLIGGGALTAVGILITPAMLGWINTPAEVMAGGISYARCYLLSMIPIVTYNMNSGIMRAAGDSRTPMLYQLAGGLSNVVLNWVMVNVFDTGVGGIAIASVIAQGIAALLTVRFLARSEGEFRLEARGIRADGETMRDVLRIGAPAGLQAMVITLSNVFVQSRINGYGVDTIAAFAAYYKIELIIYTPIVAFGQAMMTFTGQNYGAGKMKRISDGVRTTIIMGAAYAAVSAGTLLLLGKNVFSVFNSDPNVIALGLRIIRVTFPFYWIYIILETFADTLRGTGRSIPPMIIILVNICIVRTVLLYTLTSRWHEIEAVAVTYPVTWALTALFLTIYWFSARKKILSGEQ